MLSQNKGLYVPLVKPILDRTVAAIALVLTLPLWVVIVWVLKSMGKPVFFIQKRPGKNAELFNMMKFSTMHGSPPVVFPFGQFLRITSLDELPQLVNILKGEMSFVGPRPLLVEYLERYTLEERRRHLVKPGITGWAQVNGRNALTLSDKVRLDLEYVQSVSFLFDLKILLLSLRQLFRWSQADYHLVHKSPLKRA